MTEPLQIRFELDGLVAHEAHSLAATLFVPDGVGPRSVIVAVPGGTRSRGYYNLRVAGRTDFSFAEHMVALGHAVITVDHLGTGDSSCPRPAGLVGLELMAEALHLATLQIRAQLASGALLGRVAGDVGLVGLGSSMGGAVVTIQQAAYASFGAIVALGTLMLRGDAASSATGSNARTDVRAQITEGGEQGYVHLDPTRLRAGRYWQELAPDIVEADEACETVIPTRALRDLALPNLVACSAEKVTVPVFLGYGERDHSRHPRAEVAAFGASEDITMYIARRSAHYHHVAETRLSLWNRLSSWIDVQGQVLDRPR
jgi:hypothetical protein